jgi:hypothetical protein
MASRNQNETNDNNQSGDSSTGQIVEDDLEEDYYLVFNIPRDVKNSFLRLICYFSNQII